MMDTVDIIEAVYAEGIRKGKKDIEIVCSDCKETVAKVMEDDEKLAEIN